MRLVDSYGWIEYFAEGPLARKYAPYIDGANDANTVTPSVVVYEVYRKLKKEKGEEIALEAYAQMTRTRIISLDEDVALRAADISLRFGLAMADAVVYATATAHAAELVTSDRQLKALEGVKFIE